jgi:CrcB protein
VSTTPRGRLRIAAAPSALPGPGAWAAVAVGGFVGAEARYLLGVAFPEDGSIPWTTLAINVAGSLLLGMLTALWTERPGTAFWLRAGLCPGLLASFTTFSAVALAIDQLAAQGRHAAWLLYLGLSVAAGLAAAVAGLYTGRRLCRRTTRTAAA